jgi:hypothetical protein
MVDKVCPIMSKAIHVPQSDANGFVVCLSQTFLYKVHCLKEECASWNEKYGFCKLIEQRWDE